MKTIILLIQLSLISFNTRAQLVLSHNNGNTDNIDQINCQPIVFSVSTSQVQYTNNTYLTRNGESNRIQKLLNPISNQLFYTFNPVSGAGTYQVVIETRFLWWVTSRTKSNEIVVNCTDPVPPTPEDEYLAGDWDGNGKDNIAVRRGNRILMDYDYDNNHNFIQTYGNGNTEDEYLVGDWDGDGKDNIAVRRGNEILMDYDYDGNHNFIQTYGNGNAEDEYLVGDWDGDCKDNIAVRRGNSILMDFNFDGDPDLIQTYGNGDIEDEYLVGDWDGDGKDNIAVRRGNRILMDYDYDGNHNQVQAYGNGYTEDQYLVGNWNGSCVDCSDQCKNCSGDCRDNIAVRKVNRILMDYDYDGNHDLLQTYGHGTN